MSIKKVARLYLPTCDICKKTLPGKKNCCDAIEAMKAAWWASRMINGEWQNMCEDCQMKRIDGRILNW